MTDNLSLVYVKHYSDNVGGTYLYDLYFSDTPDVVWGEDWDDPTPLLCEDLTPDPLTCSKVERIETKYKLKTIEDTTCFSMLYAINGSVALSWIDIELLEEYPEEGRCTLHFNDSYNFTMETLKSILIS